MLLRCTDLQDERNCYLIFEECIASSGKICYDFCVLLQKSDPKYIILGKKSFASITSVNEVNRVCKSNSLFTKNSPIQITIITKLAKTQICY